MCLQDGSCRVVLGSSSNGEILSVFPNEVDVVVPRKFDKIKITGDIYRGATGKHGIVKLDSMLEVQILDNLMTHIYIHRGLL